MLTAIIYNNLTDQLIGALCNTLIHSLWQGLLLAAIAGLIVIFTKKATSATRYNLLVAALGLFVTAAVITFAWQFGHSSVQVATTPVAQQATDQAVVLQSPGVTQISPVKNELSSFSNSLYTYINNYHNTIVLIWFLIICAKAIQFGVGIQGVYLLKRTKVSPVDINWADRVKHLATKLGITQTVTILESGLAKVPMVVGHLKPVILIPIGLLTAMSTEEVEAILVHELAHIRRRDYLVNLLQSLAEILFFFNPAVLWISALIKTERENCCDDMALAETSSKVGYIRALVSCEEYQQAVPTYAMGLPGSKNNLVSRVKRMMSNRNHSLNMFEKGLLTVCLVMAGLCFSAFAGKEQIEKAVNAVTNVISHQKSSANPQKGLNDQAADLDNKTATADSETAVKDSRTAELDSAEPGAPARPDTVSKVASLAKLSREAKIDSINAHSKRLNAMGQLNGSLGKLSDTLKLINKEVFTTKIDSINHQVKLKSQAYQDSAKRYKRTGYSQTLPRYTTQYEDYKNEGKAKEDERRKQAINEMMKDGLITSKDDLSFKLSNTEFILNGKKQPDAVYQKYRAKYVKVKGEGEWSWMYNYDTSAHKETNTIIDKSKN